MSGGSERDLITVTLMLCGLIQASGSGKPHIEHKSRDFPRFFHETQVDTRCESHKRSLSRQCEICFRRGRRG